MRHKKWQPLLVWALLASVPALLHGSAGAPERILDPYASGLSPHWQQKKFAGLTRYEVTEEDGHRAIRAESRGTASGLVYEIDYDPRQYPLLRWEWKVANTLRKGDARTRAGDDYAARVYVIFPSLLFWKTRALNYIWANKLPKGAMVPNAFTANAVMFAVESGNEQAGQWRRAERNIYEDYRRAFGAPPPRVGAIAIMTDTDNTGETAVAWYGVIAIAGPAAGERLPGSQY